jgi:hypothetical protein
MSDTLFETVVRLAQDCGVRLEEDEAAVVSQLRSCVRNNATLRRLYSSVLTAPHFQETHLPLVGRMIGRTIGLIDANDEVVHIPNQWFPRETTNDTEPEVIRKLIVDNAPAYSIDFDEDYVAKYEEHITVRKCPFAVDSIDILYGADKSEASTSSVQHVSLEQIASLQNKTESIESAAFEETFIKIWSETHHTKHLATNSRFPNIHDPDFQRKLYTSPSFGFRDILTGAKTRSNDEAVTFRDHQQLVRNFISPLTPYRSLLLVHGTGTGKTFTTFGITEQFRDIIYAKGKKIHITCPRREICDEFVKYLKAGSVAESTRTVKSYFYRQYEQEFRSTFHDTKDFDAAETFALRHYNIGTYHQIFPTAYYTFVHNLKKTMHLWMLLLPGLRSITRTAYGFEIIAPAISEKADIAFLRSRLEPWSMEVFREKWNYHIENRGKEVCVKVFGMHSVCCRRSASIERESSCTARRGDHQLATNATRRYWYITPPSLPNAPSLTHGDTDD